MTGLKERKAVAVTRLPVPTLGPDSSRVVARPFIPAREERVRRIIERVLALAPAEARALLRGLGREFGSYTPGLEEIFERHFTLVRRHLGDEEVPAEYRRLIGAYFTCEYSFESAAVFNPSIVSHPDQAGLPEGALRYVMSLRSVGEGHVSSISFRTGTLYADGSVSVNPVSRTVARAEMLKNAPYEKRSFMAKLREMGFENEFTGEAAAGLGERFTFAELAASVDRASRTRTTQAETLSAEKMIWLARSNYEIQFADDTELSERLIFPASPTEQNGIEDARFVRFTDDDGSTSYYATYTAYDGKIILPQLIETRDFRRFKMITLNGRMAENKGMALFPRKLDGRFAMLSRQDNENIFLMLSDNLHFWHQAVRIAAPEAPWEFIQIGNCGSPLELDEGWLVLTHGVGPLRTYAIGALLLDKKDPASVIGRLREPLIVAEADERIGYVPNVVYTCGSIIHAGNLVIPFGTADKAITFSSVKVDELLDSLL